MFGLAAAPDVATASPSVSARGCDENSAVGRYASIAGARYEQLQGTGHIGMLTQPDRFAHRVSDFVHANHH